MSRSQTVSSVLVFIVLGLSMALGSSPDRSPERVLSRRRRFLIPATSGWTVKLATTLSIPLQDVGSSVSVSLPFTYSFDDGT